jgi:hypothetical protein
VSDEHATSRAGRITIKRYASSEAADRDDLTFWLQIPEADRVQLVWTLSRQLWSLRGERVDEPGLCRSVANVRRR